MELGRSVEAEDWLCKLLKDYEVLTETSHDYLANMKFSMISSSNISMRSTIILDSMYLLSLALYDQGKNTEAEDVLRLTIDGYKKVLEEEHEETLISMHWLGRTLYSQHGQKCAKAEEIFRLTIEGSKKVLGEEDKDTHHSLYILQQFRTMPLGYNPYAGDEFLSSDSKPSDEVIEELVV